MTLGVTNNFIPRDTYSIKDSGSNSSNSDSEGHGSFLEEFNQEESEERRIKAEFEREDGPLQEIPSMDYMMPSHATINDYMDNFLLLNAEQVACSNMTQHLIKSDNLKETLGFLNNQAAKTMLANKKRPDFEGNRLTPQFKTNPVNTNKSNFFSTGVDARTNNFFIK